MLSQRIRTERRKHLAGVVVAISAFCVPTIGQAHDFYNGGSKTHTKQSSGWSCIISRCVGFNPKKPRCSDCSGGGDITKERKMESVEKSTASGSQNEEFNIGGEIGAGWKDLVTGKFTGGWTGGWDSKWEKAGEDKTATKEAIFIASADKKCVIWRKRTVKEWIATTENIRAHTGGFNIDKHCGWNYATSTCQEELTGHKNQSRTAKEMLRQMNELSDEECPWKPNCDKTSITMGGEVTVNMPGWPKPKANSTYGCYEIGFALSCAGA